MFKIGEFSKLSNITVKMLRHYDEIGLLKPIRVDDITNYRYYSSSQLETASMINTYKSLGFSLKIIKTLIENKNGEEDLLSYYKIRIQEIKEEQENLKKQVKLLEEASKMNKSLNMIKYKAIESIIPERNIISLRKTVESYYDEEVLWNEIYEFIKENNIVPIYDGYTMALYHDDEYKEKNVDIEIQITVEEMGEDIGDFKFFRTKEENIVSITFSGSYEKMPKVAEVIAFYIEQNNLKITNTRANIFLVSPAQTDNVEEYVTQACYFIKNSINKKLL